MGTWEVVEPPLERNMVGCKWVFKTKRDQNVEISRYKARLVAQGKSQELGTDYDKLFSPVVRTTTLRAVLAIASMNDLEIHQMDVISLF